jgi:hypothetical protein
MAVVMDIADKERAIKAAYFEVEYEEVFHMKNLYKLIHEWLLLEGYSDPDGFEGKFETLYWQRAKGPDKYEHQIWWRCEKIPGGNRYCKHFLKIDFQTLNVRDQEVMYKGKKYKTQHGNIILRVEGWILLDYNREFTHGFLRYFDRWFRKRVYHEQKENHKKIMWLAAYRLQDTIKQYLKMKIPARRTEPFHTEKGF